MPAGDDLDRSARDDQIFDRAGPMRLGDLRVMRRDAQFIELDLAFALIGKERPCLKPSFRGGQDLGFRVGEHLERGFLRLGNQRATGHIQRCGDLPEDGDGWAAFAGLDLPEHGSADTGYLGQSIERVTRRVRRRRRF